MTTKPPSSPPPASRPAGPSSMRSTETSPAGSQRRLGLIDLANGVREVTAALMPSVTGPAKQPPFGLLSGKRLVSDES